MACMSCQELDKIKYLLEEVIKYQTVEMHKAKCPNNYIIGLHNGVELVVATLLGFQPDYKEIPTDTMRTPKVGDKTVH